MWRWVQQDRPFSKSQFTPLHPNWKIKIVPQEYGWFHAICPMCEDATRRGLNKKLREFGGPRLDRLLDERLALLASECATPLWAIPTLAGMQCGGALPTWGGSLIASLPAAWLSRPVCC